MQLPVAWENTQRAGLASQRLDCGMHMTVLFLLLLPKFALYAIHGQGEALEVWSWPLSSQPEWKIRNRLSVPILGTLSTSPHTKVIHSWKSVLL
jgi:hypothetical protein